MNTDSLIQNSFGQQLRFFRQSKGLSQLKLADLANTTPRYISFIETGRSRPGKRLVIRICEALHLDADNRNLLLQAAGHTVPVVEPESIEQELKVFGEAIRSILDGHLPYPACAVDLYSRVLLTNSAFEKLFPGHTDKSAEEAIDGFFGPGPVRDSIENWSDVAWAFLDSRQHQAKYRNDPQLLILYERALKHMEGIKRPEPDAEKKENQMMKINLKVGKGTLNTYISLLRFEKLKGFEASSIRIQLMFPEGEEDKQFFLNV